MKQETLNRIHQIGLLAVIRGADADQAEKITGALVEGGVIGIEITFTTPDALSVVETLKKRYGSNVLVGMGTLTRSEQALNAKNAGASFLVSPHTEEELAQAMKATGLPFMMGALTPSEIMQAVQLGSDVVKIFPGSLFGPGYFKSLRGPYPELKLMPTGGVNLENLGDWFAGGAYAVGVGSSLFPKKWVAEGRFEDISTRAALFKDRIEEIKSK